MKTPRRDMPTNRRPFRVQKALARWHKVKRGALTVLGMNIAHAGFALALVVPADLFGGMENWAKGVTWGIAGCLVFSLTPAIGLPPELPGMPAGPLEDRQLWWLATAACTAVALTVIFLFPRVASYLFAGAIAISPFVVGACRAASHVRRLHAGNQPDDMVPAGCLTRLVALKERHPVGLRDPTNA